MSITHLPRKKRTLAIMIVSSLALVLGLTWFVQSFTVKAYLPDIASAEARYPAMVGSRIDSCSLCHTSAPSLNPYGAAYKAAGRSPAALLAIEPLDSDKDGWTNLQEITALTFPGDANDHPAASTATSIPPTPTQTALPPTPTFTPTNVPPTATKTAVPPTATLVPTNAPPTATLIPTNVPPTATNTAVPPTATLVPTNAPPTATLIPTNVPPTATHTAVPPTATLLPTTAPPTVTNTAPPPASTSVPTSVASPQPTQHPTEREDDSNREHRRSTATAQPRPTLRPNATQPCGYYREDDSDGRPGRTSSFSGSDGDRGSTYRRCTPHDDSMGTGFNQFVTRVNDFFTNIFNLFR